MKKLLNDYKNKFDKNLNATNNLNKIKASLSFAPEDEYNVAPEPKTPKKGFKWAYGLAIAIALVIITTLTTILLVGDNNVVIYKGMDIINSNLLSTTNDSKFDEIDEDMPDIITDDSINSFARPGSEVVIRIRLDNPKDYEILSFTLNSYKYQSFEFLEGSTGKEILVKYKAPDEGGIDLITINSLKYIKGDKIKECRYDGNKTIKLGVTYVNVPKLEVEDIKIEATSLNLAYRLIDPNRLIKLDGYTKYYLFADDRIVRSDRLIRTSGRIELNNLMLEHNYTLIIASTIDLLDGEGYRTVYLYEYSFKTKSGIEKCSVTTTEDSINITTTLLPGVEIVGAKLYIMDTLYKEISGNRLSFSGVYANTEYTIEISYKYKLNNKNIIGSYKTACKTMAYSVPELNGNALVIAGKLYLDYELIGNKNIINDIKIEVYLDNSYYKTLNELNASASIDKVYTKLSLKIIVKYDLMDNLGIREIIFDRLAG